MASTLSLLKLSIVSSSSTSPKLPNHPQHTTPKTTHLKNHQDQTPQILHQLQQSLSPATAAALFVPFVTPQDALAVDGEFGILEGRSFALLHPIVMGGLFFYTLYAGYLGWQWRRVRTIQDEINELKKQVKPVPVAAGVDIQEGAAPTPVSPIESKIKQLTEERKELIKGSYKDRHFNAGSVLLGFGVLEAVGGCVNTWFRTGKLFPGPHLFAGAGITVLWALAAALVPAMQKGNETARSLHIALNTLNVLLFIWQIPTGINIIFSVFEFTKWP
ncbi:hypothetical protein QJS10_CPB15g00876 [Acorus calamus]|uniref:Uncharacterized protein n=1 Tax=Acorus calamus TaxID=4465 RepID=A0AAV9D977_ACOCL|nr:hypothetical protein QJS10_CPB15g00876 [Acorus calamus]